MINPYPLNKVYELEISNAAKLFLIYILLKAQQGRPLPSFLSISKTLTVGETATWNIFVELENQKIIQGNQIVYDILPKWVHESIPDARISNANAPTINRKTPSALLSLLSDYSALHVKYVGRRPLAEPKSFTIVRGLAREYPIELIQEKMLTFFETKAFRKYQDFQRSPVLFRDFQQFLNRFDKSQLKLKF